MKKTVDKNSIGTIKQHIDELGAAYKKEQKVTDKMIKQMKEMREVFKEMQLPTIVKSVRLTYEHIENYGSLDNLPYWEDEEVEIDEEHSSFEYYLDLLSNPTNKYNREEIKELNNLLKDIAGSDED